MNPYLKSFIRPYLKSFIKNVPLLQEFIRIRVRKKRATSYYKPSFRLINDWAKKKTELSNYYYDLSESNRSDLASLISAVTETPFEQVEALFDELENNENLRAHISNSWARDPMMSDAKLGYGRRLGWYAFIRILKPKIVVETGVHHGVGACVIASALIKNAEDGFVGQYFGTDIDKNAGKLLVQPYSKFGKILYGDSIDSLKRLNESVDIFINDSDHSCEYEKSEYETINSKLSESALILGDNSHATNSLRIFSQSAGRKFIFFKEIPKKHWYPGAGIGISFTTL